MASMSQLAYIMIVTLYIIVKVGFIQPSPRAYPEDNVGLHICYHKSQANGLSPLYKYPSTL